ncbi:MAG: hypothetical protein P1U63_03440 [Coxiellaceae bacterium]|nr:hypothetical protein [Coxiellaceae bacterium]
MLNKSQIQMRVMLRDIARIITLPIAEQAAFEAQYCAIDPNYNATVVRAHERGKGLGAEEMVPFVALVVRGKYGPQMQQWSADQWHDLFEELRIMNSYAGVDGDGMGYIGTMLSSAFTAPTTEQERRLFVSDDMAAFYRLLVERHTAIGLLESSFMTGTGHAAMKINSQAWLEHSSVELLPADFDLMIAVHKDNGNGVEALNEHQRAVYDILRTNSHFKVGDDVEKTKLAQLDELQRLQRLAALRYAPVIKSMQQEHQTLTKSMTALQQYANALMDRGYFREAVNIKSYVGAISGYSKHATETYTALQQAEKALAKAKEADEPACQVEVNRRQAEYKAAYTKMHAAMKVFHKSEQVRDVNKLARQPRNGNRKTLQVFLQVAQTLSVVGGLYGAYRLAKGKRYAWYDVTKRNGHNRTHSADLLDKVQNAAEANGAVQSSKSSHPAIDVMAKNRQQYIARQTTPRGKSRLQAANDLEAQVADALARNGHVPNADVSPATTPTSVTTTGSLSSVAVSSDGGGGYSPRFVGGATPKRVETVEAKTTRAVSYADAVRNVRPGGCGA